MNIYELEKQATPGPWIPHRNGHPDDPGGRGTNHIYSKQPYRIVSWSVANNADASLLSHCRNNFMKALEALKELRMLSSINGVDWTANGPWITELIEELEEA